MSEILRLRTPRSNEPRTCIIRRRHGRKPRQESVPEHCSTVSNYSGRKTYSTADTASPGIRDGHTEWPRWSSSCALPQVNLGTRMLQTLVTDQSDSLGDSGVRVPEASGAETRCGGWLGRPHIPVACYAHVMST